MILSAQSIRERGIITPFCERTVHNGMSYGLSVAGYDIRVEGLYDRRDWRTGARLDGYLLKENSFFLASSLEYFNMPNDILAIVHDKSTWARRGLTVQNTVIEPGWRGYLTLELTNHSHKSCTLFNGDPIAQIIFHQLDKPTEKPYEGKYQDQKRGPRPARDE